MTQETTADAAGADAQAHSPQMTIERGSFSVWQDGVKVAAGEGPYDAIRREAQHYAMIYRQDGPVRVTIRRLKPRKEAANAR